MDYEKHIKIVKEVYHEIIKEITEEREQKQNDRLLAIAMKLRQIMK